MIKFRISISTIPIPKEIIAELPEYEVSDPVNRKHLRYELIVEGEI